MFCKLFETEDLGQILVRLDSDGNVPFIEIHFEYEGLFLGTKIAWKSDDDTAWDTADKTLKNFREDQAKSIVKTTLDGLLSISEEDLG